MDALDTLATHIDRFNERIGRVTAWVALLMVLVQFLVVIMRYVFGIGSIMMQESVIYMHAFLFMIGAGYTLLHGGHVRVDVFYRDATVSTKAWVDLAGVVFFLVPVCTLIAVYSWPYIHTSWSVFEGSKETSGIQAVYLLKTTLLAFCLLVGVQGVSLALRSALHLAGARVIDPEQDQPLT